MKEQVQNEENVQVEETSAKETRKGKRASAKQAQDADVQVEEASKELENKEAQDGQTLSEEQIQEDLKELESHGGNDTLVALPMEESKEAQSPEVLSNQALNGTQAEGQVHAPDPTSVTPPSIFAVDIQCFKYIGEKPMDYRSPLGIRYTLKKGDVVLIQKGHQGDYLSYKKTLFEPCSIEELNQ